jgi:glycosyltransferase involved in cell wall biosynthesis
MAPALSIVIPWFNRTELGRTLRQNTDAFECQDAEVLVINCGGDPRALERLVDDSSLDALRIIEIPSEPFNKCLALNIGASLARAPRMLFLDTDIVISDAVLAGMVQRTDARTFATIEWVIDSNSTSRPTELARSTQTVELVWNNGQRMSFEFFRSRTTDQARGGPGLICVWKEHFLTVEGMDSRLARWGWEDLDLIIRLQAMTGARRVPFGDAIHLAHDDASRNLSGTTRQASLQRNMALCYANYERRQFLGTFARDVAAHKERVIEHEWCRARSALADPPL